MIDLIVKNGRVWNGCHARCRSADILLEGGRIVDVVRPGAVPNGLAVIDVQGAVVTPGLVDGHVHLLLGAESTLQLDLSHVRCRAEFEAAVEEAHQSLPDDRWLIGTGWNETGWLEGASPDRSWLRAAHDRPVVCWRCDWHSVLVNDAVLKQLDVAGPHAGGRVGRDRCGAANGLMSEAAAWELVVPLIPPPPEEERARALAQSMQEMLKAGITAVRSMEYSADITRHYVPQADSLPLRVSIVELDRTLPLETCGALPITDRFRVTGCKSFFDGTLGSQTARLRAPYSDAPGSRGLWIEHALRDEDSDWCQQAISAGRSPVIHAIGDEAVGRALKLIRNVPDDVRPTIEHAEVVAAEDLELMGGVRLSVQPTHRASDASMAASRLGDRAASLLPMRKMVDAGAVLSFGTDWPIVPFDPLRTLRAAITGEDDAGQPFYPDQAMTVVEAFMAATFHASEAAGLQPGLVPGGPGDFVLWNGDPFEDICGASVRGTFIDGTLVAGTLPGELNV